tara:strand:- start:4 stop:363 length:360 start_codon:yes stop_codon:yes gene_type:complete
MFTIEKKKVYAGLMGYAWSGSYLTHESKDWVYHLKAWNPTDHFNEIWKGLSDEQILSAYQIVIDEEGLPKEYDTPEEGFSVGLVYGCGLATSPKGKEKILQAIYEVVTPTEPKDIRWNQ